MDKLAQTPGWTGGVANVNGLLPSPIPRFCPLPSGYP